MTEASKASEGRCRMVCNKCKQEVEIVALRKGEEMCVPCATFLFLQELQAMEVFR
jgi:hypothetical protein